jgi:hypothetical protein
MKPGQWKCIVLLLREAKEDSILNAPISGGKTI